MGIVAWIIFGGLAGWFASWIMNEQSEPSSAASYSRASADLGSRASTSGALEWPWWARRYSSSPCGSFGAANNPHGDVDADRTPLDRCTTSMSPWSPGIFLRISRPALLVAS